MTLTAPLLIRVQYAADNGVLPALFNVGNAYAKGLGVEKNDEQALQYFRQAIDNEDATAMYVVACWFMRGRGGLPMNPVKAFHLQERAAALNHPYATFNVGAHYFEGMGVEKNIPKAAEFFEKAARLGVTEAAINYANMQKDGVIEPRDLQKAIEILTPYKKRNSDCFALYVELNEAIKSKN